MQRRDFLRAGVVPFLPAFASSSDVSCILLMLVGGPSQVDTWDMKPEAPSRVRGPFRPIKTNVSGIEISEIFPRMARMADKYALIRSCYHRGEPVHEIGLQLVQRGVADLKIDPVIVPGPLGNTGCPALDNGQRAGAKVCLPVSGVGFGASCREAVRLVESGVRFVTVNMFDTVFGATTWDAHGSAPFSSLRAYGERVGPMFDIAYTALLTDLERRGLLDRTLVVATGEFGRSPRINPAGGRDHWPECWTMLMAGGGVRGGQVIGASDATGAEPKDRPVEVGEIAATIRHAMGLPVATGQPVLELFS